MIARHENNQGTLPMPSMLDGATRVHFIVGDPIAQVKSPAEVTRVYEARGHNAMVMPAHVPPAALSGWLAGVSQARNVDAIIVTVPHKFDCFALCATTSERAAFLGAVNTMRRNADGSWHGDMFDGLGFVAAMRQRECDPAGRRALLVGAGGAGTAIGQSLVLAGVSALAVHDEDPARCRALVQRLAALGRCPVSEGSTDPQGFGVVINATPAGMKATDALPVQVDRLDADAYVGCVVTEPELTPLIGAALARGCRTITGVDMFMQVRDLMVDFLLQDQALG
jgi:shikimate dehydrogenase